MDAREYLTQILDLKRRMDKLKEKIRRYKEIASSPRSPSLECYSHKILTLDGYTKLSLDSYSTCRCIQL